MKTLILDTTKKVAIVIAINGKKEVIKEIGANQRHSEEVLPLIEKTLKKAKLKVNDLTNVVVVSGPGSFTGIRVGLATVKGLCYGNNRIKISSLTTFDVVKAVIDNGVVLQFCSNYSYYYGIIKNGNVIGQGTASKQEVYNVIKEPQIFVFEPSQNFSDLSYKINAIKGYSKLLLKVAKQKILNEDYVKINDLQPVYLQLSQAERQLESKQ